MIYFLVFLLLVCFSYRFDYLRKVKFKKGCYYWVLIILILIAGLRYRLGVDTIRYESAFRWLPTLYDLKWADFKYANYDPLYLLFSSIVKTLFSEFWMMQICQATLVNFIIFRFVRKNTENIFFALLLYYVFLYTNFMCEVMREACAVSMFLLSWEYFKKNRWIGYYIFCTLAFLFHSSAILLFFLPALKWMKVWDMMQVNRYTIVLLLLVLIVGYSIQNMLFEYINILSFTDRIENKINVYSESSLAGAVFNINGILALFFRYIIYPFLAVVLLKKQSNMNKMNMEPMITLCLVFVILSIPVALFYRYNNYFVPFSILVVANIAFSRKIFFRNHKYVNIHSFSFWLLLFIPMFFFQIYGYFGSVRKTRYKEYMRYYPYNSILDKERDENREALFMFYNAY